MITDGPVSSPSFGGTRPDKSTVGRFPTATRSCSPSRKNEPAKVIKVDCRPGSCPRAISSQRRSTSINAVLSGTGITQLRDATYLVDIIARAASQHRAAMPCRCRKSRPCPMRWTSCGLTGMSGFVESSRGCQGSRYLTKRACLNVGAAERRSLQLRVNSTDAKERTKRGGAITEGLFHSH